jgi:hypothetical protein
VRREQGLTNTLLPVPAANGNGNGKAGNGAGAVSPEQAKVRRSSRCPHASSVDALPACQQCLFLRQLPGKHPSALPLTRCRLPAPPCRLQRDFARLLRDASQGLPVAGRSPVWEAGRPTVVHDLSAQKPRGFISYERSPLPYRPLEERVADWGEVHAHVSRAGERGGRTWLGQERGRVHMSSAFACAAGPAVECRVAVKNPHFAAWACFSVP